MAPAQLANCLTGTAGRVALAVQSCHEGRGPFLEDSQWIFGRASPTDSAIASPRTHTAVPLNFGLRRGPHGGINTQSSVAVTNKHRAMVKIAGEALL